MPTGWRKEKETEEVWGWFNLPLLWFVKEEKHWNVLSSDYTQKMHIPYNNENNTKTHIGKLFISPPPSLLTSLNAKRWVSSSACFCCLITCHDHLTNQQRQLTLYIFLNFFNVLKILQKWDHSHIFWCSLSFPVDVFSFSLLPQLSYQVLTFYQFVSLRWLIGISHA